MASPLAVIALVSGGKDSFFSLLHCLANGHHIVALANLYPDPAPPSPPHPNDHPHPHAAGDQTADLNSYMFQTAGHTLVPLYGPLLDLPIYRRPISGTAVNTSKDYLLQPPNRRGVANDATPNAPDETESLIPLLTSIIAAHPTVNALSTGAILSTYQRTRIESVAQRLGLLPLSWLWQYPTLPVPLPSPAGLLRDLAAVGLEARIVKVASGGLDDTFLGENVCDERVIRMLERVMGIFGGSVLGEGGEYETLVMAGPRGVFAGGRMDWSAVDRTVRRGQAGEACLHLDVRDVEGVRRAWEDDGLGDEVDWKDRLARPRLWDVRFDTLLREVEAEVLAADTSGIASLLPRMTPEPWSVTFQTTVGAETVSLSNIVCRENDCSVGRQMHAILATLAALLAQHSHTPSRQIVFSTLLLRSMSDFATVNAIYRPFFPHPNPPARVTVACGDALPAGTDIMLSVVLPRPGAARVVVNGLHVQSRSYWAPANIGPYSQAVAITQPASPPHSLVFVAGQIPLIPASMTMLAPAVGGESVRGTLTRQTVLALQHLCRVGRAMDVGWWGGGIAFVAGEGERAVITARVAWSAWKQLHRVHCVDELAADDDDEVLDVWDRKYGGRADRWGGEAVPKTLPDFRRVVDPHPPPNGPPFSATTDDDLVPGFLAVQVAALPLDSAVEWHALGYAGACSVRLRSFRVLPGVDCWMGSLVDGVGAVVVVEVPFGERAVEGLREVMGCLGGGGKGRGRVVLHTTLYTVMGGGGLGVEGVEGVQQVVPCRSIWGRGGREVFAGVVGRIEFRREGEVGVEGGDGSGGGGDGDGDGDGGGCGDGGGDGGEDGGEDGDGGGGTHEGGEGRRVTITAEDVIALFS